MTPETLYAHFHLDNKLWTRRRLHAVPRVGDTVRFQDESYGKVSEVVWCLDEDRADGLQRVNIAIAREGE